MKYSHHLHGAGASSKEQEYLEGWKRARAELVNYRQRVEASGAQASEAMKRALLEPLMSIADNFQAITQHVPPEIEEHAWTQGVLHVARQFDQLLREYGLTVIGKAGEPFDPRRHEAVKEVPAEEHTQHTVAEVTHRGYQIGETVIRPAKVTVYT